MMGAYTLLRLLFNEAEKRAEYQTIFEEERDRIAATAQNEEERQLLIEQCVANKEAFIQQKQEELETSRSIGEGLGCLLFLALLALFFWLIGFFDMKLLEV